MEVRARRAHRPLRLLAPAALLFGLALLVPFVATAATVTVEVKEFEFVGPDGPGQPIRIQPGDTIVFENTGRACHTVSRGQGALGACEAPGTLRQADFDFVLEPGEQARVTFGTQEAVPFYCRPHVTILMVGNILVGDVEPVGPEPEVEAAALDLPQMVVVGLLGVVGLFVGAEVYWRTTRQAAPMAAPGATAVSPVREVHLPGEVHASLWPFVVALGCTVFLAGLLFPELRGLGALLLFSGVVAWGIDDMRDLRAREAAGLATDDSKSDRSFAVVILILAELMLFGVLFAYFFWARLYTSPWPPAYVEPFDMGFVSLNTAVLLTSGATGHFALEALRRGQRARFRGLLLGTIVLGAAFLAGQGVEYATASFSWTSGSYGTAFFALTGTHGAHVAAGIIALGALLYLDLSGSLKVRPSAMAAVTLYWHFVDAVWVALFAFIYLQVV